MKSSQGVRNPRALRSAPAADVRGPASGQLAHIKTGCMTCNLRELCVPCCGLSGAQKEAAGALEFGRIRLRRGQFLYRSGDRFTALYALRNGFFKTFSLLEDGRDQVTGFSIPGEILGMDGIALERHSCNAVALEDSEICAIPFAKLLELAQKIPALQHHFHRTMSREIVREHGVMLQLGSMNAEERLSIFLLDLSRRFAAHGDSGTELNLRMTREEIGSYLGLKLETVSRTLSRFHDEGLIAVQNRLVRILDRAGLEHVMRREQDAGSGGSGRAGEPEGASPRLTPRRH